MIFLWSIISEKVILRDSQKILKFLSLYAVFKYGSKFESITDQFEKMNLAPKKVDEK